MIPLWEKGRDKSVKTAKKAAKRGGSKRMSETIGIKGRLRQINVRSDTAGRVKMDATRQAEIVAGKSNLNVGDILIFDFDGDSSKISKKDNDRTDNVRIECKVEGGPGGGITTFTVGKEGDEHTDKAGDAPFEGIREQSDEDKHLNVFHAETQDGHNVKASFRQVRESGGTEYVSNWLGPYSVGRQGR